MNGRDLEDIAQYVNQCSGLFFHGRRMAILRSRVTGRLSDLSLPDMKEYFRYLRESSDEKTRLLDLLTTNETSFFRNRKQFSCLTARIIPRIEEERGRQLIRSWNYGDPAPAPSRKLRILCAGCSTGEEPYSLGMALMADLRYPRAWEVEIVAGDLNESCLRTAAAGFYSNDKLKGIPADYLDRFLVKTGSGAFIADEVKKLVDFRPLNLMHFMDHPVTGGSRDDLGRFDIIFCRNVMIYFSAESQQRLVDALHRLLVPGGYLLTGDAEPLHLYRHEFTRVHDVDCLIYRKGKHGPAASAPCARGGSPQAESGSCR